MSVLLLIVLIQCFVIGIFIVTDSIDTISLQNKVVAIVAKEDEKYIYVENGDEQQLFAADDNVRFINFKHNQVYLFDYKQEYLHTLVFDSTLTSYTKFIDEEIEYQDTRFKCEPTVCMLEQASSSGKSTVQLFPTLNLEYVLLDADNFER